MPQKTLAVAKEMLVACEQHGDTHVTPMQLLKLVYIAHGYMLGRHSLPLLNEPVEAWQYGPVIRSLYDSIRQYRDGAVPKDSLNSDEGLISPQEKDIINIVAGTYGSIDAYTLSASTHQDGTPWSATWRMYGRNSIISNDMIESFYSWILNQPSHSSL